MNSFDTLVQETVELADNTYLQKAYNRRKETYSLLYREHGRYSEPVEITHGIENEENAEELIQTVEEKGFKQLRERLNP